jgi:hypothetical protein
MTSSAEETVKPPRLMWDNLAALLGGALWIVFYGIDFWVGRQLAGVATEELPPRPWAYGAFFCGGIFCISASLVGLQRRLRGHAKGVGIPALLLAGVGLLTASINGVLLTGLLGPARFMGWLAAIGVMSLCVSTTLLGVVARREPLHPRWASTLLLTTGVLTVVLIFASGLRFGPVPTYVVHDLPFALSGIAWLVLGRVPRAWQPPHAPPVF